MKNLLSCLTMAKFSANQITISNKILNFKINKGLKVRLVYPFCVPLYLRSCKYFFHGRESRKNAISERFPL